MNYAGPFQPLAPAASEPPPSLPSLAEFLSLFTFPARVLELGVYRRNMDGEKGEKTLGTLNRLTDLGVSPPLLSVLPIATRSAFFNIVKWCLWVLAKRSFKTAIPSGS